MTETIPRLRSLAKHQPEAALRELSGLIAALETDIGLSGRSFPFPEFDALCHEIGKASAFDLLATGEPAVPYPHELVLVTEATVEGGHAEIIKDIADCAALPLVIVATNLHERRDPVLATLRQHPRVAEVVAFSKEPLLAKLRRTQALLANPAAARVLALCHGSDAVSIAAIAGIQDRPVLFFHHCDHTPSLGCFLPHAAHIDLHNIGFQQCRGQLGIDPRYICLTSQDTPGCRASGEYAQPVFKSATCGGEHKLTRLPYPISYKDVLVQLIAARGGVHYHVGVLSGEFVAEIRSTLRAAGLAEDAFVHVGEASGLRAILVALGADLYIPTLPQSGGKALIDAMSAGVPVLVHENAVDRLWGGRDLVYPEAPSWSCLHQLPARLQAFDDPAYWQAQATASRAHFDRHHARGLFAQMLTANGAMAGASPPPLAPYRPAFEERQRARALSAASWTLPA